MQEQGNVALNEKTRMLEMAFKYTNGDAEKAKAMVSGQYNDIVVVKAKLAFHKSGKSGLILAFFNTNFKYIAFLDSLLMSNSGLYNKVRIFNDWKSLMKDLNNYKKDDAIIKNSTLTEKLLEKFSTLDMFSNVSSKVLDDTTRYINNILNNIFPEDRVSSQLELEDTNSVNVGGMGIYINAPQIEKPAIPVKEEQKSAEATEQSPFEARQAEIESEAEHVIEGVSIVSPVKGKYIGDLVAGDIIMVLLPRGDAISKKILEAVKAMGDDGSIKPVKGRLKHKIIEGKGPYYLYVLVAKGVYAKLTEEENVKIRVEASASGDQESKGEKSNKVLFIALGFLVFLILAGFLYLNLFR